MAYVLVTADFPDVNSEQRNKIYTYLREKKWVKITEPSRDIDTVWEASFAQDISEIDALHVTMKEFMECSQPHCKPKLVIHWGPHKPTRHGLV